MEIFQTPTAADVDLWEKPLTVQGWRISNLRQAGENIA